MCMPNNILYYITVFYIGLTVIINALVDIDGKPLPDAAKLCRAAKHMIF